MEHSWVIFLIGGLLQAERKKSGAQKRLGFSLMTIRNSPPQLLVKLRPLRCRTAF